MFIIKICQKWFQLITNSCRNIILIFTAIDLYIVIYSIEFLKNFRNLTDSEA